MITMLSNSLLQQHNVNRLTCQITMKVVSEDSSCSMVWWGARAACAEVSIGQRNPRKPSMAWGAIWHLRCHMEPDTYGRIVRLLARVNLASSRMLTLLTKRSAQQRLRSWCRRTLESGVRNQRTMRGRGKRRT
jgi:hypothetical protein